MTESNVNIQMRLTSVNEVSFMMSPGKITEEVLPENIKLGFSSQIQPEVENNKIALIFGIKYELEGDKVLECVYRFEFEVSGLAQFITIEDNDGITITYIRFRPPCGALMRPLPVFKVECNGKAEPFLFSAKK